MPSGKVAAHGTYCHAWIEYPFGKAEVHINLQRFREEQREGVESAIQNYYVKGDQRVVLRTRWDGADRQILACAMGTSDHELLTAHCKALRSIAQLEGSIAASTAQAA